MFHMGMDMLLIISSPVMEVCVLALFIFFLYIQELLLLLFPLRSQCVSLMTWFVLFPVGFQANYFYPASADRY